ncbi:MAG TPA: hypothetical protein VGM37_05855 [Armatimonadota bacterium]|jgi:hypothetical protein
MTTCPRCNAANEADRAACWNCFAPLTGPLASKVKPMTLVAAAAVPQLPAEAPAAAPTPKRKNRFGKK